jgi:hypothetical protein
MTDPRRYHAIYLAALPSGLRTARVAPPLGLDAKHFYPPTAKRAVPQFSLPQLYVAGIDCGNAEAREELKRRVIAHEDDLKWFRTLRDRTEDDRIELAEQLADARRGNRAPTSRRTSRERAERDSRARQCAGNEHYLARDGTTARRGSPRQDRTVAVAHDLDIVAAISALCEPCPDDSPR